MNRLTAVPTLPKPHTLTARARRPQLKSKDRQAPPQCLLAPLHYEPNYAYPLLVWLHGTGGNERELHEIMPLISLRNYAAAGVRGTAAAEGGGFDWPQSPAGIHAAMARVAEAVARARERFNVHSRRVFLAGYGAGGTMALRLALLSPRLIAGGVSINGCFPAEHAPLAQLSQARDSRLLIAHCRDSQTYSTDHLCRELALFHAAGLSVTLRQYPCPDELTTQMLTDVDAWLMEQITGERVSEPMELPLRAELN